jgi:hypothetical protein
LADFFSDPRLAIQIYQIFQEVSAPPRSIVHSPIKEKSSLFLQGLWRNLYFLETDILRNGQMRGSLFEHISGNVQMPITIQNPFFIRAAWTLHSIHDRTDRRRPQFVRSPSLHLLQPVSAQWTWTMTSCLIDWEERNIFWLQCQKRPLDLAAKINHFRRSYICLIDTWTGIRLPGMSETGPMAMNMGNSFCNLVTGFKCISFMCRRNPSHIPVHIRKTRPPIFSPSSNASPRIHVCRNCRWETSAYHWSWPYESIGPHFEGTFESWNRNGQSFWGQFRARKADFSSERLWRTLPKVWKRWL